MITLINTCKTTNTAKLQLIALNYTILNKRNNNATLYILSSVENLIWWVKLRGWTCTKHVCSLQYWAKIHNNVFCVIFSTFARVNKVIFDHVSSGRISWNMLPFDKSSGFKGFKQQKEKKCGKKIMNENNINRWFY